MTFETEYRIKRCADHVKIQPVNLGDLALFDKMMQGGSETYTGTFSTPKKERTYSQLRTVWKLVTIIFQSMEYRKPTEDERYNLYLDLLDEYGEKRMNPINGRLIPVHVSDKDPKACAYFIEGLMLHLAQYCDLQMDAQTQVRSLLFEWELHTGKYGSEFVHQITESEYKLRHPISEASGKGGTLHLHHIVPKGECEALRHVTANWVMLTEDEHMELHRIGVDSWLNKYPHLVPKFARAKQLKAVAYD